jgi:hypothetical protein
MYRYMLRTLGSLAGQESGQEITAWIICGVKVSANKVMTWYQFGWIDTSERWCGGSGE